MIDRFEAFIDGLDLNVVPVGVEGREVDREQPALATGLGANPVLVRKLLVPLARDGIVLSATGKNAGVRLARPPEQITLLDIYWEAVADKRLFAMRPNVPGLCVVSRNIARFFDVLANEAGDELSRFPSGRTIAERLTAIRQMDGAG